MGPAQHSQGDRRVRPGAVVEGQRDVALAAAPAVDRVAELDEPTDRTALLERGGGHLAGRRVTPSDVWAKRSGRPPWPRVALRTKHQHGSSHEQQAQAEHEPDHEEKDPAAHVRASAPSWRRQFTVLNMSRRVPKPSTALTIISVMRMPTLKPSTARPEA